MSVHYKHPVLLIESEEDKAFTLDASLSAYHDTLGLPRTLSSARFRIEIIREADEWIPSEEHKTNWCHRSRLHTFRPIKDRPVNVVLSACNASYGHHHHMQALRSSMTSS